MTEAWSQEQASVSEYFSRERAPAAFDLVVLVEGNVQLRAVHGEPGATPSPSCISGSWACVISQSSVDFLQPKAQWQ